jgi:DNA-binding beta-propeller fold protein YncE
MKCTANLAVLLVSTFLVGARDAGAGQVPGAASDPNIPISHRDRVYAAEQFSNTVSVTDPVDNKLLGVIRLGDPLPASFSPLYRGQLLVHGLGFSPDHRTLAVVAIGSNAAIFIDTATNTVKHVTYVGRSPHEAFFTPDGKEVWVVVRGENYVAVLDGTTYQEKTRIVVANGPGMTIFSPDGKYGYVCSSFTPETAVITVADHKIVGKVQQASPFCPNIAATPDGAQVWFTLKDTGKVQVFDAQPPFALLKMLDVGPITNHVNIVRNANGMFAYVTVGGVNEVQLSHQRFFQGGDDSCRQTAPWHLAVRRRHAGLCRPRERGPHRRDRYVDKQGDRDEPNRTGGAGGGLRAQRHSSHERERQHRDDDDAGENREPAAARRRRAVDAAVAGAAGTKVGQSAHQRVALRPGPDAGVGGFGHRPRAGQALRTGAVERRAAVPCSRCRAS